MENLLKAVKEMYTGAKKDEDIIISLSGKPVGLYSSAGKILEVMDNFNLPPQQCVPAIIAGM